MSPGCVIAFKEKWLHVAKNSVGIIIEVKKANAPPLGIPKLIYKVLVLGEILDVPKIYIRKI